MLPYYTVLLNVYDISPVNRYLRFIGLGLYHTAVEIQGREFTFGGGEQPIGGSGISMGDPLYKHGYQLRETRIVGTVRSLSEVDGAIRDLQGQFFAEQYDLVKNNCNHFSDAFCYRLIKKHIPSYINRLAIMAHVFGCSPPRMPVGDPEAMGQSV